MPALRPQVTTAFTTVQVAWACPILEAPFYGSRYHMWTSAFSKKTHNPPKKEPLQKQRQPHKQQEPLEDGSM